MLTSHQYIMEQRIRKYLVLIDLNKLTINNFSYFQKDCI